jgi:hypothetical protein
MWVRGHFRGHFRRHFRRHFEDTGNLQRSVRKARRLVGVINQAALHPKRAPARNNTEFQFGTATGTISQNLPLRPTDFVTLEIETPEMPALIRGRLHFAERFFADHISAKSVMHYNRGKI